MSKGKVWLVGAGPGDAGLLTQKAAKLLQMADVIVYDALISLEILCQIPMATPKIYAGKRAGQHSMSQHEINQLLVKEALSGKKVVRLKGGDPFVFGRGGEEIEVLIEHGIPFEVVPGITSAIAAPAYAGIPVTHREYTSSFHVVTGHVQTGYESRVDYEALVKLNATLVFLMGVGSVDEIAAKLIGNGMKPDTPAAIIENGSAPFQRQVLSTIEQLPEEIKVQKFGSPAIILVGGVAGLMKDFHWLDALPLFGKQCIVTRAADSSQEFSDRLREKGAHVVQLPMIDIQLKEDSQELLAAALQDMRTNFFAENWIVLSSPHDVDCFFQLFAESDMDLRDL
ncbi:MAG: uroporphyrinogen-III C-methyltransferase, partial [Firmicutes bacterium]|nr:uroporphyrinogen-III C-methyltransferase [Bacillota bacterium]